MGATGKDGIWYNTWAEKKAADMRYDQTQLLRRQTETLEKQQRDAERQRRNAELAEMRDRMVEMEAAKRQLKNSIKNAVKDSIQKAKDIFCHHGREAGIGDPSAYFDKLMELYSRTKEENRIIAELTIEDLSDLKKRTFIAREIRRKNSKIKGMRSQKLQQAIDNLSSDYKSVENKINQYVFPFISLPPINLPKTFIIALVFAMMIDLVLSWSISLLLLLIVILELYYVVKMRKFKSGGALKKLNDGINAYNDIVEEFACHDRNSKIQRFEQLRLDNFNPKLESLLITMSELMVVASTVVQEVDCPKQILQEALNELNPSFPDFRLEYYPDDFLEELEASNKRRKSDQGIDVFDDL